MICSMSDISRPSTRGPKVYEDLARELRAMILRGELLPGARLPAESELAEEFGVSRTTVREALRLCAGQDLIRTAEGSTGGSFVARPSGGRVSESLRAGLDLLMEAQEVSVDDLLEIRLLLEVPAARLAAARRSEATIEDLAAASAIELVELSATDQFVHNEEFHSVLLAASGNRMLPISARPVFAVLQRNMRRSELDAAFHKAVNDQHRRIAAAVAAASPRDAERAMVDHLEFLRPYYERAWRQAEHDAER
jgi:GntR family transcriptional regulator, transcriptional repressor for pyruvate dehydrogenase complex